MTKDLSVTDIVATLEQAILSQKCNQDHSPGPCKVKVEPEERTEMNRVREDIEHLTLAVIQAQLSLIEILKYLNVHRDVPLSPDAH